MLRPKVPTNPMPTGIVTPPAVIEPTNVVQHPVAPAPTPVAPLRPGQPCSSLPAR